MEHHPTSVHAPTCRARHSPHTFLAAQAEKRSKGQDTVASPQRSFISRSTLPRVVTTHAPDLHPGTYEHRRQVWVWESENVSLLLPHPSFQRVVATQTSAFISAKVNTVGSPGSENRRDSALSPPVSPAPACRYDTDRSPSFSPRQKNCRLTRMQLPQHSAPLSSAPRFRVS